MIKINEERKAAIDRNAWKSQRAALVAAITVTTASGKTFDGDENSQGRIARALIGMPAAGLESMPWTLADNTVTQATFGELSEALALAGAAQSALWVQS